MKKIIGKILSMIFSVMLISTILFSSFSVFAEEYEAKYPTEDVNFAKIRAEIFLKDLGKPTTLGNGVLLENLNGSYEAVSFSMAGNGYIIVNIKDLTIPELSFESPNPYLNVKNPVYNGILSYYSRVGDQLVSLKDNTMCETNQFNEIYSKENILNKENLVRSLENSLQNQLRHVNIERYIDSSLRKWYISGGHCGSIASAICMRYYHDYVNRNYVPNGSTSESDLISLMQQYVGSGGTSTDDLVNGLNRYFSNRNINNSTLSTSSFSFGTIRNKINNSRPVIIDTDGDLTYGEHWIIAHGYFTSPVDGDYVIVNNGWGSNNVWLNTDSGTLDDLVYFSN